MANITHLSRVWYFLISCNGAPREIKKKCGKSCNTFAVCRSSSSLRSTHPDLTGVVTKCGTRGNRKTLSRVQDL